MIVVTEVMSQLVIAIGVMGIANYMSVKIWNALIRHWSAMVLLIAGMELMKWVAVNQTKKT